MEVTGYRGPQTCKIVGITYRQLDYWTRTGLVVPSVAAATGSGSQRLYSFNDLLQLKVVKSLTDAGASLQKVRQAIDYVRDNLADDWSKVTIVTDGAGVYACTSDAEVVDLLRSGQGVLGAIVAVDKVREQLAGTLRELRPVGQVVEYGDTAVGEGPEAASPPPAVATGTAKEGYRSGSAEGTGLPLHASPESHRGLKPPL